MQKPVLVTSAAGQTGGVVAQDLLSRGIPARALVRKLDDRADALRSLGAEVVQGDMLQPASVAAALEGVDKAFFAYPVVEGPLEAAVIFANAALNTKPV